jgi:quinol monooxygenase YgiN
MRERDIRLLCLGVLLVAALAVTSAACAQGSGGVVYLVTYIDVTPKAVVSGAAVLERYRAATHAQAGSQRADVLQEMARPDRFAILETWSGKLALDAHDRAPTTIKFRQDLGEIESGPYDERICRSLSFLRGKGENGPGSIFVLTHVDVAPDHVEEFLALIKDMSAATAHEGGNVRYQVLQQTERLNHFTVAEQWANGEALEAHAMATHTHGFRARLQPMIGALYDQRLYRKSG